MTYKYLNDNGLKTYTKKVKGALKDLHTPIAISSENTTESKARNVKNLADFIAKAKAAGIADVNGMAVTCLISGGIENGYSGVGYFHILGGDFSVQGIIIKDDLVDNVCFTVYSDGQYGVRGLIVSTNEDSSVTSEMLAKGARNPIILTPKTTEVDEGTYRKLLSDSEDVVFIANEQKFCVPTYRAETNNNLRLSFSAFSCEGDTVEDTYLYGYQVDIAKTGTHSCKITPFNDDEADLTSLLRDVGFINRSALSPVLQEIDLTGTDAERKAKLAKFEADWKDLTGASGLSDLTGARFVGCTDEYTGVFTYDSLRGYGYFAYAATGESGTGSLQLIQLDANTGSLTITPLFSHLAPITIKTGSAAADIAANKAVIKTYRENLVELGVNTSQGYQVSVVVASDGEEYTGTLNIGTGTLLMGIVSDLHETHHYPFHIDIKTGIVTFDKTNYFLEKTSNEVTEMLDAIKYSYTPVPLTATTLSNKAQLEVFLSKVPTAQVMHVTYKDVYAGTLHKINGSWYGVLVGESNTLAGQLSIKLQADGTIVEGTA